MAIEAEENAIKNMREHGVEVVDLKPDELQLFKDAAQQAIDKNIDKVGVENYHMALEILGKSN